MLIFICVFHSFRLNNTQSSEIWGETMLFINRHNKNIDEKKIFFCIFPWRRHFYSFSCSFFFLFQRIFLHFIESFEIRFIHFCICICIFFFFLVIPCHHLHMKENIFGSLKLCVTISDHIIAGVTRRATDKC